MSEMKFYAAGDLEGKIVNGWTVKNKLAQNQGTPQFTGGNFSTCYLVERNGETAFMKVLDFEKIRSHSRLENRLAQTEQAVKLFHYETNLSNYCRDRKVSKVVSYVDSGETSFDEYPNGDVFYIVYELAEGDVRHVLNLSVKLEFSARIECLIAKLKSLHDVAVGLRQLHDNDISHQDIKPSNILAFKEESKIGDLGRSIIFTGEVECPFLSNLQFVGDNSYAPPECFFSDYERTPERFYQIDNYMLGNLIVYFITGTTFNCLLDSHLPEQLRLSGKRNIQLPYSLFKADIVNAYQAALLDVEKEIPLETIRAGLLQMVGYLCHPVPEQRGHPGNPAAHTHEPNHDLHRTIQELDCMQKKAAREIHQLHKK